MIQWICTFFSFRGNRAFVLIMLVFPFAFSLAGLGCDRAFCGAYWRAQGLTRGDFHSICSHEAFKPVCATFLLSWLSPYY
jgi:hypothetical protein